MPPKELFCLCMTRDATGVVESRGLNLEGGLGSRATIAPATCNAHLSTHPLSWEERTCSAGWLRTNMVPNRVQSNVVTLCAAFVAVHRPSRGCTDCSLPCSPIHSSLLGPSACPWPMTKHEVQPQPDSSSELSCIGPVTVHDSSYRSKSRIHHGTQCLYRDLQEQLHESSWSRRILPGLVR